MKDSLEKAIREAITKIGLQRFKETSFFVSNWKTGDTAATMKGE